MLAGPFQSTVTIIIIIIIIILVGTSLTGMADMCCHSARRNSLGHSYIHHHYHYHLHHYHGRHITHWYPGHIIIINIMVDTSLTGMEDISSSSSSQLTRHSLIWHAGAVTMLAGPARGTEAFPIHMVTACSILTLTRCLTVLAIHSVRTDLHTDEKH